jgi:acetylornithine deacetylase
VACQVPQHLVGRHIAHRLLGDAPRGRGVAGGELEFLTFTATTDARFFNLYFDVPATCYGPLGGNLHAPDEWVDLESVRQVTRVLAAAALDWCGVA